MQIKRVIISGGGTGGHIYPAIAIANALQAIDANIEFLFVGAAGKMEMEKVPKAGFAIKGLPIAGINRQHLLKNVLFPFKLVKSLSMAFAILKEFKPDVAIGVGGYASGPLLLAAWLKGIPFYIQEQNSYAGITNKFLGGQAKRVFVAYPGMERFFKSEKLIISGNPVRKDLIDLDGKKEKGIHLFSLDSTKPIILIIGGSQGARSINKAIEAGLSKFVNKDIQVIWQTGIPFEEEARRAVAAFPTSTCYVSAFIYEMDLAYAVADLVISRAGALSVSEICLAGKPSILVPFPNAAEDHQTENAKNLVRQQAAILLEDSQAMNALVDTALNTLEKPELLAALAKNSLAMGKPSAAIDIAQTIMNDSTQCA